MTRGEEAYTELDYTIFNPLRDPAPEQCAAQLLERLREGDCEVLMAELPDDQEYRQTICKKEWKYPLSSWELRNRKDKNGSIRLFYWVWRLQYSNLHGQVWVTVEKESEKWKVSSFEAIY